MFELDTRGVPGCFVLTTAFEQAARIQCQALGFEPAMVWLEHPIQNRTPDELRALAQACLGDVLSNLTSRPE